MIREMSKSRFVSQILCKYTLNCVVVSFQLNRILSLALINPEFIVKARSLPING